MHDDSVPTELFTWLAVALNRCPNVKYVVLEQLGNGLVTEPARMQFGDDFLRMDKLCPGQKTRVFSPSNEFGSFDRPVSQLTPLEDAQLYDQQRTLAKILETAPNREQAQAQLATSSLANSVWQAEQWDSAMLETALAIAQKWQHGFNGSFVS